MAYIKVVDISRHNGEARNPQQMVDQGVEGVIMRATVGDWYTDSRFYDYWEKFGAVGLKRNAYHVVRPNISAQSQVARFKMAVGNRKPEFGKLGWLMDCEMTDGQTQATITSCIWFCCNDLTDHGGVVTPIYTRASWWNVYVLPSTNWSDFPLHIARYTSKSEPWSDDEPSWLKPRDWDDWAMWQHTETGNGIVHGMESPHLDLNRAKPEWFEQQTPPPDNGEEPYKIFLPNVLEGEYERLETI